MDKINDIEKCMTPGGNVKEIEINSKCRHLTRIITKDYQKKQIGRINKIIKGKIFQTIEYIKHQFNRITNVAMK